MQLDNLFKRGDTERQVAKKLGAKRILRYLISIALVVVVYKSVDFGSLVGTLKNINPYTGLYLVLAYLGGQVISAVKWRVFLEGTQIERSLTQVLRAYFFGMFVNTYGLGTVGGDVARAVVLRPGKGNRAAALATVVADRMHGLTTLLTIGAIGVIVVKPAVLGPHSVPLAILAIFGLIGAWFFLPAVVEMVISKDSKFYSPLSAATAAFVRKPSLLVRATLISVIFHFIQISMFMAISQDLGLPLSLGYLIATVPLINVASALPISVNGIGIREVLTVFLFTPMGVSHEQAVVFGALWIVTVTLVSAVGGLFTASDAVAGEDIEAENVIKIDSFIKEKKRA